jgi:hypothetical protein
MPSPVELSDKAREKIESEEESDEGDEDAETFHINLEDTYSEVQSELTERLPGNLRTRRV